MTPIRHIASAAVAAMFCLAGTANAATYDISYAFATGDSVTGSIVGTLTGTTLANITAIDLRFDGIDFGTSLTSMTWNSASSAYVDGLTLSTIAAQNNFIVYDATGTCSFSFSVASETGTTQVAATNLNSLDHSAAAEDSIQSSWVVAAAPVPEPETLALMAAGLGLVGFATRRTRA